jgi:hypothetical protein
MARVVRGAEEVVGQMTRRKDGVMIGGHHAGKYAICIPPRMVKVAAMVVVVEGRGGGEGVEQEATARKGVEQGITTRRNVQYGVGMGGRRLVGGVWLERVEEVLVRRGSGAVLVNGGTLLVTMAVVMVVKGGNGATRAQ